MARRSAPSLRRRGPSRPPKTQIWVFCEGEKTEPDYLIWFARQHRHESIEIRPVKGCGVPRTVVEKARDRKRELERLARPHRASSFDGRFEVWVMIDRDEHPQVVEAWVMARDNGIGWAFSNPCVELWGVLHVADQTAAIHRHDCQALLHALTPSYHHERGACFDPSAMVSGYDDAVRRARHLEARREAAEDLGGNPSTTVYRLTESIRGGGTLKNQ
ncbi:MAG: RloB domain-containing protein [Alphaproteobacteria bacterium]|nr:RloB domain-containing protein [Alphaproteobacteria bacterium]